MYSLAYWLHNKQTLIRLGKYEPGLTSDDVTVVSVTRISSITQAQIRQTINVVDALCIDVTAVAV